MTIFGNDNIPCEILHYNVFTRSLVTVVIFARVLSKQIVFDFLNTSAGVTALKEVWRCVVLAG